MGNLRARVEAAFGSQPSSDPSGWAWTEITNYLLDNTSIHMKSGRQEDSRKFNGGTFGCMLDNRTRRFSLQAHADVLPNTPIRYSLEYPWLPGMILFGNGGFDLGNTTGWGGGRSGSCSAVVVVTDRVYDNGGYAGRLTFNSTAAGYLDSSQVTVVAGTSYAFSGRYQADIAGFTGELTLRWFSDAAGTALISSSTVNASLGTTAWSRLAGVATAPAGAVSCRVRIGASVAVNTNHVWVDSVVLDTGTFQGITTQGVFFVDEWKPQFGIGESTVMLSATDAVKVFSAPSLNSVAFYDYAITLSPTNYWRLGETGRNKTVTYFKDSISGDQSTYSFGITGVGPLFDVAGHCITDNNGAFSTIGPSSADSGGFLLPTKFAPSYNGSSAPTVLGDWAISFFMRATKNVGVQTLFGMADAQHLTNWSELWCRMLDNHRLEFRCWDTSGNGLAGAATHTATTFDISTFGISFDDHLPHLITFVHHGSNNHWDLWVDGINIGTDTGRSATSPTFNPTAIGFSIPRTLAFPGSTAETQVVEFDELMMWDSGTVPADSTWLQLYDLARLLYPAELSGRRLHRILNLVGWGARSAAYSSQVLAPTPRVWLRMQEPSTKGTTVSDYSGNSLDCTLGNANWTRKVPGPILTDLYDTAMTPPTDGSSTWLKTNSATAFNPGGGAWSFGIWLRAHLEDTTPGFQAVLMDAYDGTNHLTIKINANGLQVTNNLATMTFGQLSTLVDGNWHQIFITSTGSGAGITFTFYIDGVAISTGVGGAYTFGANTGTAIAGSWPGPTNQWVNNWSIDEPVWYHSAVAGAFVASQYLDAIPGLRTIEEGSSTIDAVSTAFSQAVPWEYMQKVEESEQGWLFVENTGNIRWVPRRSLYDNIAYRTIQALFDTVASSFTQQLSTDGFTRANGVLGSTDGATTLLDPLPWVDVNGTWAINTNVAAATALVSITFVTNAMTAIDAQTGDVDITCTFTTMDANGQGIFFRYIDNNNFYLLRANLGTGHPMGLWRVVGGTFTNVLAPAGSNLASGSVVRVVAVGNVIQAYLNGTLQWTYTAPDTFNQAASLVGMESEGTAQRFDNFTVVAPSLRAVPFEEPLYPVNDDRIIINRCEYAAEGGGETVVKENAASEAQYFTRTDQRSGLLLVTDEECGYAGQHTLDHFANAAERVTNVTIQSIAGDDACNLISNLWIADRVVARLRPPGIGGSFDKYTAFIVGVSHQVRRGKITATYDLSTADVLDYMIFGQPFGANMGW